MRRVTHVYLDFSQVSTASSCWEHLQRTEHCYQCWASLSDLLSSPQHKHLGQTSARWPHADRLHFLLVGLTFCIADGLFIVLFCIQKFYFHIEATLFLSNTWFLLYIFFEALPQPGSPCRTRTPEVSISCREDSWLHGFASVYAPLLKRLRDFTASPWQGQ